LPSTPLEIDHLRMRPTYFHNSTNALEDLTWILNLDGPTQVRGCAKTLTRLEIAIKCLYPALNDELEFSDESEAEHMVVYQQLGLSVNLQYLPVGQIKVSSSIGVGEGLGGRHFVCYSFLSGVGLLGSTQTTSLYSIRPSCCLLVGSCKPSLVSRP